MKWIRSKEGVAVLFFATGGIILSQELKLPISHINNNLLKPIPPEKVIQLREILAKKQGWYLSSISGLQKVTTASFWIDYDSTDRWASANLLGRQYGAYVWDVNWRYVLADTQFTDWAGFQKKFVVAFHSIVPMPNQNTNYPTPISSAVITSITVDSIGLFALHCSDTSLPDTLIFHLVKLGVGQNAIYPDTNTIWFKDTLFGNEIPTDGNTCAEYIPQNWNYIEIPVGWSSTTYKSFGVVVKYLGLKDTHHHNFWFYAGYPVKNGVQCQGYDVADTAFINYNSYSQWVKYAQYGLLPTPSGANIYYDCNGDNSYSYNSDGETYIQNIGLIAKVTVDTLGGGGGGGGGGSTSVPYNSIEMLDADVIYLDKTKEIVLRVYPALATSNTTFSLYNLNGQLMLFKDFGITREYGGEYKANVSHLSEGLYFYEVKTDAHTLKGKLLIY